jgi:hypothetical protein
VRGQLPSSQILDAAHREGDIAAGLPELVDYSAFESGDVRFCWLHDAAQVEGDGAQFFYLNLRRAGDDWEVTDVDPYDSPEDAMQAAGREWLIASGGPELPIEPVDDFA